MIAIVLAAQVASGIVVDANAAVDGRATFLSTPAPDPTAPPGTPALPAPAPDYSLVFRPSLAAAVSRDGAALALAYKPQLSFDSLYLSGVPIYAMNAGELRAGLPVGERLTLRALASGEYGTLDPSSAQSALSSSGRSGALDQLVGGSYGAATVGIGATGILARTLTLDVDATGTTASSIGTVTSSSLPSASTGTGDAALGWRIDRRDTALLAGEAKGAVVTDRGAFYGAAPSLGYRRVLFDNTGLEVRAGYGLFQTLPGVHEHVAPALTAMPVGVARAETLVSLAGATAFVGGAEAGLDVENDPLGALLEDRASGAVHAGLRLTKEWSCKLESAVFAPIPSLQIDKPKTVELADVTWNNSALVSYALGDRVSVGFSGAATTRVTKGFAETDLTLALSLAGTFPVFHAGDRPAGSDPRAGRDVDQRSIGAPPPLGATTIVEPEPLPPIDDEDVPAAGAPVPLHTPPPNVPIVEDPLKVDTLKKVKPVEKKKKSGATLDVDPIATPPPDPKADAKKAKAAPAATP
ncbi:MAG TPA: hypothetical protein VGO62_10515 [Myxococcota bacterium]